MKAGLAFETVVTEKVIINGAVGGGEAQTRGKSVLELLADKFGVASGSKEGGGRETLLEQPCDGDKMLRRFEQANALLNKTSAGNA
jgi:hypothetical protein